MLQGDRAIPLPFGRCRRKDDPGAIRKTARRRWRIFRQRLFEFIQGPAAIGQNDRRAIWRTAKGAIASIAFPHCNRNRIGPQGLYF